MFVRVTCERFYLVLGIYLLGLNKHTRIFLIKHLFAIKFKLLRYTRSGFYCGSMPIIEAQIVDEDIKDLKSHDARLECPLQCYDGKLQSNIIGVTRGR